MRLLVTGAAGFLGSHLCDRLLAQDHTVVGMDNLLTGTPANLAHLGHHRGFQLVRHDVSTFIDVPGPVDGILHFASPASPIDYLEFPIPTLKVGALGTHNALGLAKAKGARFLLASTSEVYGDPLVHPQPESYWGNVNPVGPRGVYDEAKRFAEAMTMAYHRYHRLDTRIVRIFNTYGPRMRLRDGRVVSNFIVQALRGEPLTMYGDGSQTRSFCYVDDLIEGIVRLFELGGGGARSRPTSGIRTSSRCASSPSACSRSRAAAARSSSIPSPRTTRGSGARTSRAPARRSAGSRACRSRTACAARSTTSEASSAGEHASGRAPAGDGGGRIHRLPPV
jgi:dTDP-glucose 4,6-dehydratase